MPTFCLAHFDGEEHPVAVRTEWFDEELQACSYPVGITDKFRLRAALEGKIEQSNEEWDHNWKATLVPGTQTGTGNFNQNFLE